MNHHYTFFKYGFASKAYVFSCILFLLAGFLPGEDITPRSRITFGLAFQKLREGMPAVEVEGILGKADDIRTGRDPNGISSGVREVWCYGTDGHFTFPTLASVYFDDDGKVKSLFGTNGAESLVNKLGDGELNRLLRIISLVPGRTNPGTIIQAVNALQPLGKESGCAVLREYLRITMPYDAWWKIHEGCDLEVNLFLLVRALFDVPISGTREVPDSYDVVRKGYLRSPGLGATVPAPPNDRTAYPRFPLHIVDGVPLGLVGSGYTSGQPERVINHLLSLEKDAIWRSSPLIPPDNPFSIVKEKRMIFKWFNYENKEFENDQHSRVIMHIESQLRAMTSTVVRLGDDTTQEECALAFEKAGAVWDVKTSRYTFNDGSVLIEPARKIYFRTTYSPKIANAKVFAIVERDSVDRVRFILNCRFKRPFAEKFSLAIFAINEGHRAKAPITSLSPHHDHFPNSKEWGGQTNGVALIKEGQAIQIIYESEGKEQASDVFNP